MRRPIARRPTTRRPTTRRPTTRRPTTRRPTTRRVAHGLLAICLAASGCALDLDRLRARDAAADADLEDPVDAPSLDASVDAAVTPDAFEPERDGVLAVLARIDVTGGLDLAAGRDARGAFFVLLGSTGSFAQLLERDDCTASRVAERTELEIFGTVLLLDTVDEDALLDVAAANGSLIHLQRGMAGAGLPFGHRVSEAADFGTPRRMSVARIDALASQIVVVTDSDAYQWGGVPGMAVRLGTRTTDTLDGLAFDFDGGGNTDLVRLRSTGVNRELQVELGDGTGAVGSAGSPIAVDGLERLVATPDGRALWGIGSSVVERLAPTPATYTLTDASLVSVVVADLDGDATDEIVALDGSDRTLRALRPRPMGSFAEETLSIGGIGPIAAVDLDADDRSELLVLTSEEILVIGRLATTCPQP
jgi:hypothetical protein